VSRQAGISGLKAGEDVNRVLLNHVFLKACVVALVSLIALWAFVSYMHPTFSGERVSEILRCN